MRTPTWEHPCGKLASPRPVEQQQQGSTNEVYLRLTEKGSEEKSTVPTERADSSQGEAGPAQALPRQSARSGSPLRVRRHDYSTSSWARLKTSVLCLANRADHFPVKTYSNRAPLKRLREHLSSAMWRHLKNGAQSLGVRAYVATIAFGAGVRLCAVG